MPAAAQIALGASPRGLRGLVLIDFAFDFEAGSDDLALATFADGAAAHSTKLPSWILSHLDADLSEDRQIR